MFARRGRWWKALLVAALLAPHVAFAIIPHLHLVPGAAAASETCVACQARVGGALRPPAAAAPAPLRPVACAVLLPEPLALPRGHRIPSPSRGPPAQRLA